MSELLEENMYLSDMHVIKRNGDKQPIKFDKITERITKLVDEKELEHVNVTFVALQTIKRLKNGMKTEDLDKVSSNICANLNTTHPFYSVLGARILMSNLHKTIELYDSNLNKSFVNKMIKYHESTKNLNEKYLTFLIDNQNEINDMVDYSRDFTLDFFTYQTLIKSYLFKNTDGQIIETPQDMFMRVASFIHMGDLQNIKKTYDLMSLGYFTHASPTLFNCGTKRSQLASCFLMGTNDSIEGIFKNFTNCALIQKWAGGIGIHVDNIRGNNSSINGTGGKTNGLFYMLKLYNELSRYINQGGKRNGSIAIYMEPHHCDIENFLELKKNVGDNSNRTRDLFLALWVSDYFMEKVYNDDNDDWYLMSPDDCPGLSNVYGDEYKKLYDSYVEQGKYRSVVSAKELCQKIFESMFETGVPYIAFKDHVNRKSNQQNLGTIKSSNLCIEIMQYSDDNEYAVCNLASICLNKFINNNVVDYEKLYDVAYQTTINLNRIIDINYYPVPETTYSNMRHRPIGLGIQGLADLLAMLNINYDCDNAVDISKYTMETIYYASLKASNDLAKCRYDNMKLLCDNYKIICDSIYDYRLCRIKSLTGELHYLMMNPNNFGDRITIIQNEMMDLTRKCNYYLSDLIISNEHINKIYHEMKPNIWELKLSKCYGSYASFVDSPFSKGVLQFDMWNITPSIRYDWNELKNNIVEFGTRNSLLTACMPTASTSQIMGNNECFEPFTSNIYKRDTLAGEFIMCNKYMVNDLIELNLWNNTIKNKIIENDGSIQKIDEIPLNIKNLYKTVWEIPQSWVLKHAHARAPYIDQSQSMNIFFAEPNTGKLYSCLKKAWDLGLKTGCYYHRTKPSIESDKFTICESCSG